jgi:hypothetical protein
VIASSAEKLKHDAHKPEHHEKEAPFLEEQSNVEFHTETEPELLKETELIPVEDKHTEHESAGKVSPHFSDTEEPHE